MWQDYLLLNPEAQRVVDTLPAQGRVLLTIILRSERLMSGWWLWKSVRNPFLRWVTKKRKRIFFEAKKLRAEHDEYKADQSTPKIFISELLVDEFSTELQDIVNPLVFHIYADQAQQSNFFFSGGPWNVSLSQHETLLKRE